MKTADEMLEELSDEDVELETVTYFNLLWTCPKCKHDNYKYNVPGDVVVVKCKCKNCSKTYTFYNCIY